ncbi:hypothetical protein M422DRAFT_272510 [Sphaerobolus stellatus SS14]|uniref:DUF6699 domain-containing protein n=1 Tax=Sphaerobolus stellatus (strain SS14) TaxID=990650 RepID=A0A0C9TXA7_SPHS4|nr:hypothetical protein M422DRAFT_272510 [Sphaerobolus stellatus SS14]
MGAIYEDNNPDGGSASSSSGSGSTPQAPGGNEGSTSGSGETESGNTSLSAEGGPSDSYEGSQLEEDIIEGGYGLEEEATLDPLSILLIYIFEPVATLEEFIDQLTQHKPVIWLENGVGQIGKPDGAVLGISDKYSTKSHPSNFIKPSRSSVILINELLGYRTDNLLFYFDMAQLPSSIKFPPTAPPSNSQLQKTTHLAMTLMGIAIYSSEGLSVITIHNTNGVTVIDILSALYEAFRSSTGISRMDESQSLFSLSASQIRVLDQAAFNLSGVAKGGDLALAEHRVFTRLEECVKVPNIWVLNMSLIKTSAVLLSSVQN